MAQHTTDGVKRQQVIARGLVVGLGVLSEWRLWCRKAAGPLEAPLLQHRPVQGPLPTPIATDENEHDFRL